MDSPVLLNTAAITLAANQHQEINDPTRLQNPFRTPMMLDEIRFVVTGDAELTRHYLQAKFRIGRIPLTKDYTPIVSFGKSLRAISTVISWRLPKPLYVPANEYVIPHIRNTDSMSRTIQVVYAGRSLGETAPSPKSMFVPWVTSYQAPTASTAATDYGTDLSTEADIVNPFDVPLYVQRFIGRYLTASADTTGEAWADYLNNTMIRAVNHEGTILVKDGTPFGNLFDFTTKVWPAGTILPPKGFFLFEVTRDFTSLTTNFRATAPIISMVGYREVPLQ